MCGIAGLVSKYPLNPDEIEKVYSMNNMLFHRGPDSMGLFQDTNIVLAMRRLKIIDLIGGEQPLYNEDGSLILVVNGEIYNHVELRRGLENRGHKFKTHSDCETILHLYEESGEDCLRSLRGMFAFALFDKKEKRLFIARDRLSEKPLYYYRGEKEIVFSSEMKSLLLYIRKQGIRINPDGVNMYFHYQYIPEPVTSIEGVFKLPAAHYLIISLKDFSFHLKKYWDIEDVEPVSGDPATLIREAFDDLSRIIIRADVPVGIALSGGIDSGAIATYAAKHYPERMHAFSVGYEGRPQSDERSLAMELSKKLGLTYHEVELKTEDLANSFPEMVYYMDDPIADIAAFGYYSVSRLARQNNVPVILSGVGGDELFWGYLWVSNLVEKNIEKQKTMTSAERQALRMLTKSLYINIKNFGKRQQMIPALIGFINSFRNVTLRYRILTKNPESFIFYNDLPDFLSAYYYLDSLYTNEFRNKVSEKEMFSFFNDNSEGEVPIKTCKFLFQTWLYSNCVALGDRMSMASSIELRLPFLDYQFVELIMGLRKTYKDDYKLGYKKWFIDAMNGDVPHEILHRRKRGFTPPMYSWYKAVVNRYGKLCYDGYLVSSRIMEQSKIIELIERSSTKKKALFFAYKIVLMEVWCRIFILGEDFKCIASEV